MLPRLQPMITFFTGPGLSKELSIQGPAGLQGPWNCKSAYQPENAFGAHLTLFYDTNLCHL